MRFDEHLTSDERKVIEYLKHKTRMEQDQIIYDYEGVVENG